MKTATLRNIAEIAATRDANALRAAVETAIASETGSWLKMGRKFLRFLDSGNVEFSVIVEGNAKLPFLAFSTLPFVTCPGMGACENFCYSIRAWRYAGAFFRQLQNTWLLWTNAEAITRAIDKELNRPKFRKLDNIDFRLYVDGDFDNMETLSYWMDTIRERPMLKAYGYSKSWELFRDYAGEFPANYRLNVSSGSRYDGTKLEASTKQLPVARGRFVALKLDTNRKFSALKGEYRNPEYKAAVRKSAKSAGMDKVFVCPGQCGTCTSAGHACGSDRFKGIAIAIGVH